MSFWLSTLEQAMIFSVMVLGVFITYKILDFPDLSVDGTFPLGASIAAAGLIHGVNPIICLILALIGGAIAGFFTGYIHTKFGISSLLAGILIMIGLYSVNLRIMGRSNIHLFNVDHLFKSTNSSILTVIIILAIVKIILDLSLKTKFGFILRALGDNEKLVNTLGVNPKKITIIGLMIGNGLTALSGGILAQYQGFSDVGMGTGTIVTGLASIILGESIIKENRFITLTTIAVIGSILYRFIIALALKMGLEASDLKLITSLIVIIILALKNKQGKRGVE